MAQNEKYSYKSFTHQSFVHTDPSEWNDTEVVGSCFYQENKPDTQVFPDGIRNVKFIRCNLDNVFIPETCTVEGGCRRRIMIQNDLEDWIVDKDNKPVEPLDKARYLRLGLSIDPRDLPTEKASQTPSEAKITQEVSVIDAQIAVLEEQKKVWR